MPFKAGAIYGEAFLDTTKWTTGLTKLQKSTALSMGAMTAIFTTAMITSAKATNEFSKALANVSTLVDTSAVNMKGLSDRLIHLDPALGDTTELTKGMYQAFSSGAKDADEAMALTVQGAKFAKAAMTDTFTAVDVLSTAMNAYGKEVISAEKASDLFFTTIKLGKVTGEELASSIGSSIPLFSSVGISLEELSAGLASMTKQGVKASNATTQLNAIVNSYLKPSSAMIDQLEKMGYASGSAFLEAEGLTGALAMLEEATAGDSAELAKLVPNVRAIRGVMALSGTGAEEYTKALEGMETALGATDEAFKKQDITWETARNSLSKVGIEVGKVSKEFIDGLAVAVTKIATGFTNLDADTKNFISTFIPVGALVGATTLAVIGLNVALTALAANPITLAITGVALLTTGLISLAKTLNDKKINETADKFIEIAEAVGVTADQTKDLGKAMNSLEDYLGAQALNDSLATAEQSAMGLRLQLENISETRGIEQEQLIQIALTSEDITEEQKKQLKNIQTELVSSRELLSAEEETLGFASGITVQRKLAKLSAEHEKVEQQAINDKLKEQQDIQDKLDQAQEERELKAQARLEGVIEARKTALETYNKALETSSIREGLGITSVKEKLEANLKSAEEYRDSLIAIGFDLNDSTQRQDSIGNKALANIISKRELLIWTIQQEEYEERELADVTVEVNDEIKTSTEDTVESLKVTWQDYFNNVTSGLSEMLSLNYDNTKQEFTNEQALLDIKYQNESTALQESFDNGLITEEEYNNKKKLIDSENLTNRNELAKKAFDAEKKNKQANVIMSGLSSIMGWWEVAPTLGPIAGPIFAGLMTAGVTALSLKQLGLINSQQYVPAMASGGTASGLTRINEIGGEIVNLPDGSLVIPNDISRQIAQNSNNSNVINVSFAGASISNDMELNRIVEQVSRKLGRQLRTA